MRMSLKKGEVLPVYLVKIPVAPLASGAYRGLRLVEPQGDYVLAGRRAVVVANLEVCTLAGLLGLERNLLRSGVAVLGRH